MTGTWIAVAAGAVLLAGVAVALALPQIERHAPAPRGPRAAVVSLQDSTSEDSTTGAVRSAQTADLLIEAEALAHIWTPEYLERLARTYWRFLTRVTLGLVRVHYGEGTRAIVLLTPPFRLLTFREPEYEMDPLHGLVRWRIERGLLVSKRGRGGGYLQIVVRRGGTQHAAAELHGARAERLNVEVEVANFYPAIALSISRRFYNATQSRIHVIITYAFLRSLARLDLARSRVGRLRVPAAPQ